MASKLLLSSERRMFKNTELSKKYKEFMIEYRNLNHMEKVESSKLPSSCYFLPHSMF